jgi:hypothetical protein
LEWAGHVVRMEDERMVKRVFWGNPGGRRNPKIMNIKIQFKIIYLYTASHALLFCFAIIGLYLKQMN